MLKSQRAFRLVGERGLVEGMSLSLCLVILEEDRRLIVAVLILGDVSILNLQKLCWSAEEDEKYFRDVLKLRRFKQL